MEFDLSSEQVMLQDSLHRFLTEAGGLERTRAFAVKRETRAQDLIDGLAELGVAGLLIAEVHGGSGLSLLDAALAAEVLGRHVAAAPFVGSAVIAPMAIQRGGSAAQQREWLPRLASGKTVAGAAVSELAGAREDAGVELRNGKLHGRALFVLDFEADLYVVADRDRGLHLVAADAKGLTRNRLTTIDVTRPTGELRFDGVAAEPLSGATRALCGRLIDAGRIVLAADTLGAAQEMLDRAVAYAKARKQFGRAIGSFQAVKHMCAEMAAALEPCRALVWYAGHAFDALPDEASLTACHAKAHLAEVGTRVARTATEVHGGMGFTDLVGTHYWFKRIGFNRQMLGGPQRVREEAARLAFASGG
jgi:alkylation response protein AidB-like acyl-CoA dehydrogenase